MWSVVVGNYKSGKKIDLGAPSTEMPIVDGVRYEAYTAPFGAYVPEENKDEMRLVLQILVSSRIMAIVGAKFVAYDIGDPVLGELMTQHIFNQAGSSDPVQSTEELAFEMQDALGAKPTRIYEIGGFEWEKYAPWIAVGTVVLLTLPTLIRRS